MLRWKSTPIVVVLMSILLSGCLYPGEEKVKGQRPAKDAILTMQMVIEEYQKDTEVLPIFNSEPDTPKYEKYLVDFDMLMFKDYISDIPVTAFEKGGSYYYLIINEETKPTIKLMNLVQFQKINDIQTAMNRYRDQNGGKLPVGEMLYPGFSQIDYSKLSAKEPEIKSVFTGQTLLTMVDESGKVYIDYGIDITQALTKGEEKEIAVDKDLRELLVDQSDFVPVKSPFYRLVNGEPQASLD